jgi:hypothetical protein
MPANCKCTARKAERDVSPALASRILCASSMRALGIGLSYEGRMVNA